MSMVSGRSSNKINKEACVAFPVTAGFSNEIQVFLQTVVFQT